MLFFQEATGAIDVVATLWLVAIALLWVLPVILMNYEMTSHHDKLLRGLKLNLPAGVVVLTSSNDLAEAVDVVVAALGNGHGHATEKSLVDWILAPSSNKDHRQGLLRWMVRFQFACATVVHGSVVLGVRLVDGSLAAVACVVPYLDGLPEMRSQTSFLGFRGPVIGGIVRAIRSARAHAMAVTLGVGASLPDDKAIAAMDTATSTFGKAVERRFHDARAAALQAQRVACASARAHLHVGPIAVNPLQQGHGHAKTLLRHVSRCADAASCACYLECTGEHTKTVFAKFGYQPVEGVSPLTVHAAASAPAVASAEDFLLTAGSFEGSRGCSSFEGLWPMERPIQWDSKPGEAVMLGKRKFVFPKGGGAAVWADCDSGTRL